MNVPIDLELAERATRMLLWGVGEGAARAELGDDPDVRDALEVARLRVKAVGKFRRATEMLFDEVGLETATPEAVAMHRGKRLAAASAVDLTCGVGGDTIGLAAHCGRVTAIEEDERRLSFAEHNCRVYGLDNVTFQRGDALVRAAQVEAGVVFADPLRRKDETRVAGLEETLPSTSRLIARLGKRPFAVEVSSTLPPRDLDFAAKGLECEREWIGLDREVNCCTLYFGPLARCDTAVVLLPGGHRLERARGAKPAETPRPRDAQDYLFEMHEAVTRAEMEGELAATLGAETGVWGEAFLTSRQEAGSPFFVARYEVLERAPQNDADLVRALKRWGAGKVLLRWPMGPGEHARRTRAIRARLTGRETITAFREGARALLCRFLPS